MRGAWLWAETHFKMASNEEEERFIIEGIGNELIWTISLMTTTVLFITCLIRIYNNNNNGTGVHPQQVIIVYSVCSNVFCI